jgi:hypothetical protein
MNNNRKEELKTSEYKFNMPSAVLKMSFSNYTVKKAPANIRKGLRSRVPILNKKHSLKHNFSTQVNKQSSEAATKTTCEKGQQAEMFLNDDL